MKKVNYYGACLPPIASIRTDTKKYSQQEDFSDEVTNFEDLLEATGGFGKFQCLLLIVLLSFEIPAAFVAFAPVFVGKPPESWICKNAIDGKITELDQMSIELCSCNGTLAPSSDTDSSIVTEWDLFCGSSFVSDLMTSIQMVGMLIGGFFSSQLSDWYGRKKSYLGVCLVMGVGQLLSAAAPHLTLYAVGRFIAGAGLSGFMGMSTIYPLEFLTPKYRQVVCFGPWGFGVMLLSLLAYFVPDWRQFLGLSSLPFFFIILYYPFLPESPRWLLRNDRLEEAQKVLGQMHSVNFDSQNTERVHSKFNVSLEQLTAISRAENESNGRQRQSQSQTRVSYLYFFRSSELRAKTFYLMGIWFAWACVYFGISYNIKNVRGNVYWNVVFLGLTDALANPCALLVNNRLGRRKALISFMSLGTVFLIVLAALDLVYGNMLSSSVVAILCLVGRFGVAGSRTSTRLLTSESFPTHIRTMGYGITGFGAGIGGIIAPQLAYFGAQWWNPLPFVTFAFIGLGGSALSLLLKETADLKLDENCAVQSTRQDEESQHSRTESQETIIQ